MNDIEEIYNYILFLRTEKELEITLHPLCYDTVITSSKLHRFNIHENSYCVYLKSKKEIWKHCIERQNKILKKCQNGSFCGSCFAGVREYVYPITADKVIGFISVSGYKDGNGEEYCEKVSNRYNLPVDQVKNVYDRLKSAPPKRDIDTLLNPLCRMLELAYVKREIVEQNHSYLSDIVNYLRLNHTVKVTIDELCSKFHLSRSKLSKDFKEFTGQTISEYIKTLRIESSKNLLKNTKLNISEIAIATGFDNGNYFSSVFKENVGTAPKEYRKKAVLP